MGYDFSEYKQLGKWFENMQSLPNYDENQAGAKFLADLLRGKVVDDTLY